MGAWVSAWAVNLVDRYAEVRRARPPGEGVEEGPMKMKRDLPGVGGDGGRTW